ncbi:MAG: hypothetical protein LH613_08820, partial [Chamaesiphon sp.]|nr:hypothetical protein [Chamaesiphon sp.]
MRRCRTQPGAANCGEVSSPYKFDKTGNQRVDAPLITSLSHNCYGARITGDSIYRIVQGYAEAAGIVGQGPAGGNRRVSPHRLRHSSITAFLDASDGNIRTAQALSRHSQMNTLTLYDDNRKQQQKGASGVLEGLLSKQDE